MSFYQSSINQNSRLDYIIYLLLTFYVYYVEKTRKKLHQNKKIAPDAGNIPTSEAIYSTIYIKNNCQKSLKAMSPKTFQSAVRHCCDLLLQTAPILWETAYNRKIEEIFHPIGL